MPDGAVLTGGRLGLQTVADGRHTAVLAGARFHAAIGHWTKEARRTPWPAKSSPSSPRSEWARYRSSIPDRAVADEVDAVELGECGVDMARYEQDGIAVRGHVPGLDDYLQVFL